MAASEDTTSWSDGSTGSYTTEDDGTRTKRFRSRLEGYDSANLVWRRIKVDSTGALAVSSSGGGGASTIADGADVAEGATTDAAVVGDSSGTVSGKLRGLSKIWNDVWDSVNHRVKVDGSGVTQPVSGTFWQSTQPVSLTSMPSTPVTGTFFQGTQPVSLASAPVTTVTVGTDSVGLAKDSTLGVPTSDSPGAFSVLDQLSRIRKVEEQNSKTLQALLALQTPALHKTQTTLLHRS